MVRNGKMIEVESLSELGIYGTYLRRGKEVIINRQAGHLVRTKVQNVSNPKCIDTYVIAAGSR